MSKIPIYNSYGEIIGYDVEETDSSNLLTPKGLTIVSRTTRAYEGISKKELAERLAIEGRHAHSDVDCR